MMTFEMAKKAAVCKNCIDKRVPNTPIEKIEVMILVDDALMSAIGCQ